MYKLGTKSLAKLQQVHPELRKVVMLAIELTIVDFTVLEGARAAERQRTLYDAGASKTLNSRHIPGVDGWAKAVDLGAWVDGQVDWSWPLYRKIAVAMKEAANQLGVAIVWGGDWRSFKDGPHFELDRSIYP